MLPTKGYSKKYTKIFFLITATKNGNVYIFYFFAVLQKKLKKNKVTLNNTNAIKKNVSC